MNFDNKDNNAFAANNILTYIVYALSFNISHTLYAISATYTICNISRAELKKNPALFFFSH